MFPRLRAAATLGVGLMLLVAACSTGGGMRGSAPAGDGPELTELRVGTLPIVDVAPVHIAIREGLFADEGLSVTTEVTQGGAAAIPALVGGDLEIAYGAWPSFLLANQEGIELRAIADGTIATPGFTELLALPDSGLEGRPDGLVGRTIAVNTLNNIGELAVRSTLRDAGVDTDAAQLVEIPFPDMPAALERGDVDVIWASEPVPTIVKSSLGAVVVADSFVGPMERFPVAGYQVTAEFAEANPRTVAAFQRAMQAASELANEDPSLVAELLPEFTNMSPELAGEIALPDFGGAVDPAGIERVHDYLLEFGILSGELDVDRLVPPGA